MKNIKVTLIFILTTLSISSMAQLNSHITEKEYIKKNKLSAAVTEEVTIDASKEDVWEVISNWGDAYIYTPGLDKSYCLGKSKTGPQSKRHCDIGKGYVEEEVLLWEEGNRFVQQVYEMEKIPMVKKIIVELQVVDAGKDKSKLIYTMAYKMPMGKLMKGTIGKSIRDNAYAVKHYIETGDNAISKSPKQLRKLYF